jgi:hypothetical protein
MIATLGIYYVWILNQNSTRGYNVSKLKSQYKEFAFQEKLLDTRIAEGKSIDSIMRSPTIALMQDVEKPIFLVQTDTSITFSD